MTDWEHALEHGPLHRFRDWPVSSVRRTPGVYTVWDQDGRLVYVGIAIEGMNGLRGRLASHANGRRSEDTFNVYVADRFVLPKLTRSEICKISTGALSFDGLVKKYNRGHLTFRVHETATAAEAADIEQKIKAGQWLAGEPFLNPRPRSG